jgi:16S rRNA (guanine527-N7)-methyltransferase
MFHVKLEPRPDALPAERVQRLKQFESLLEARAVPLGLIARNDSGRTWTRHIEDSLRARACLLPRDHTVVDLGSGAGLPGLPLAIAEPARRFVLVEPRERRAAFLEWVVAELGLRNVHVEAIAAEQFRTSTPLCTARALAAMEACWRLASPVLEAGGRLLYFAGAHWKPPDRQTWLRSGAEWEVCAEGRFSWEGPLVIIRRSPC